ncbi:hypothetical protein LEMLEM_LOCUS14279, partial [Lemmus lemmus]
MYIYYLNSDTSHHIITPVAQNHQKQTKSTLLVHLISSGRHKAEFKASLVYIASSRTVRPCLKPLSHHISVWMDE